VSNSQAHIERFRHHPGRAVAGLIIAISLVTLAGVSAWLGLLALIPLAWSVWAWRAGTDADRAGVRVRALVKQRWIPWSRVRGLVAEDRHRVVATLTDGAVVPLTAVNAADLPRLTAAGGQEPADPAPPVPD
jgi:hypothetical protein